MDRLRVRLVAIVISAFVCSGLLPASVGAAVPITFNTTMSSNCAAGTGQANSPFLVRLLTAGGELVARANGTSNGSGDWYACFGNSAYIMGGMKLRATGGGSDRTITIPVLTMRSNRVSDKFSGRWIPSTMVTVCASHYTSFNTTNPPVCRATTASATGTYSIDFTTAVNIRGADYGYTSYSNGTDTFGLSLTAPLMQVARASAYVSGSLNPGQAATLTLMDAADQVRGTANVVGRPYGGFEGYFMNSSGTHVFPRVGDKVVGSFASDATLTIPDVTASGLAATDVVSGQCLPSRPISLFVAKADYSDNATFYGSTNSAGAFSHDFSADIDLAVGDDIRLYCKAVSGDVVVRFAFVRP